jgi:hypothetical protein
MSLMITEVYDALRAANVPEPDARRAAEALGAFSERLTALEARMRTLEWMVWTNIVLTIAILALLGGVYLKLVDLAVQVGRVTGHT